MLLRSLTKHVKDQNWFAVALDFLIVVVGILIAFQITNWNDGRAEFREETHALDRLKKELNDSIAITNAKSRAYQQALDAGKRSLEFLGGNQECGEKCWDVVVDFMHASQWQDLDVNESSYQNMRGKGFPVNTTIIDAVEAYRLPANNNSSTFLGAPTYRSLVRQMIDVDAQEFYWKNCWSIVDGNEEYLIDCPEGMSSAKAKSLVEGIVNNPGVKPHLTEWIGKLASLPETLGYQNDAALKAVDLISEELETR